MPDEPNKHIDELLKAYAKKRREDAGAPTEMHPATRKMLQSEVAKLAPESRSESWFARWLSLPRLAFVLPILVAVAVGAFVMFQPKQPMELAKNEARQERTGRGMMPEEAAKPTAAPARGVSELNRPTDGLAKTEEAVVSKSEAKLKEEPAAERERGELVGDVVRQDRVAAAPAEAMPRTVVAPAPSTVAVPSAPAPGSAPAVAGTLGGREKAAMDISKKAGVVVVGKAGAARDFSYANQAVGDLRSQNVLNQRYSRVTENQNARVNARQQALDNVLLNFQIEQTSNNVRIVDADGSTYSGEILPAQSQTDVYGLEPKKRQAGEVSGKLADKDVSGRAAAAKTVADQQTTQAVYFRATGTNRSLNQLVVFEGNVVPDTNTVQSQVRQAAPAAKQAQTEALFSNARIQGRAVVGKDEIAIDAVAVEK